MLIIPATFIVLLFALIIVRLIIRSAKLEKERNEWLTQWRESKPKPEELKNHILHDGVYDFLEHNKTK